MRINKENATIILENQSFMTSKKAGHAAIKLSMIGINFKNYLPARLENTPRLNNKALNFINQVQYRMQLMLWKNSKIKLWSKISMNTTNVVLL